MFDAWKQWWMYFQEWAASVLERLSPLYWILKLAHQMVELFPPPNGDIQGIQLLLVNNFAIILPYWAFVDYFFPIDFAIIILVLMAAIEFFLAVPRAWRAVRSMFI